MNFHLKIIAILFFIGYNNSAIAEKSDSLHTIISMEFSRFNSFSYFDIPSFSKSNITHKLKWQSFGLRVHQELNSVFQINTGIIVQSTSTDQFPNFPELLKTNRTFYKNKINFITIPIGAKTSINVYKRKIYTGLSFAFDLNFHQGKIHEYAADFSNFMPTPYKEQSIFVLHDFYASQEVGLFLNYFYKDRLRILMSVNAIIENDEPIIIADIKGTLSQGSLYIFDGNGIKVRFQLGYSFLKSKSLFGINLDTESPHTH